MECRIDFRSQFETAKEVGLVSEKEITLLGDGYYGPQTEAFIEPVSESILETHPAAIKAHKYGSSLDK